MKRNCPVVINGCPGVDSPITNASSEAPDPLLFAGYGWSPYNPFQPPPLNGPPRPPVDCSNITWSTVSPELAQLFAQINAQVCQPPQPPTNTDPVPFPPPITGGGGSLDFDGPTTLRTFQFFPPTFEIFTNDQQSASVTCPNGSVFTMTIEAGAVSSPPLDPAVGPAWVQYINNYLLAFILQNIYDLQVCLEVPAMDNRTPPGVPPVPNGHGPTLSANPGWICAGDIPAASTNTYHISGQIGVRFTFSVSGNLPPGMTLVQTDPRTAVIQGTATTPGVYNYTVRATRVDVPTIHVEAADTYNVIGFTNSPPDATQNSPYSFQLATSGAVAPVTFEAQGALPTGLSLAADGTISGTPTVVGTSSVEIKMTDANGAVCFSTISLEVETAPVMPIDWDDLQWGVASFFVTSFLGSVAFSPQSAASDSFGPAHATENGAVGTETFVENIGRIDYNGPATTAYMHITCFMDAVKQAFDADVNVTINTIPPTLPVSVASAHFGGFAGIGAGGPFTIPINVPDTGGVTKRISVQVFLGTPTPFIGSGINTVGLSGTFDNNP